MLLDVLKDLIENKKIKDISISLNVAQGTINRWLVTKSIPRNYEFEILKLANKPIDYSKYDSNMKDQFFTKIDTAKKCFEIFKTTLQKQTEDNILNFHFIEPSAGDGSFLNVLPENTLAFDIEPRNSKINKCDYLDWCPNENEDKRYVIFGNPPFGLRGHIALKFIKHSYNFADYVCFILPQLFESDGKGSPRKRIIGYNLIKSVPLTDTYFYRPDGNSIKINTIFQIWSKHYKNDEYVIKNNERYSEFMKVYSISIGEKSSSIRNKKMINNCDVYIPSTCYGSDNMKAYKTFEELPHKRGYGVVFLKNKNTFFKKIKKIDWKTISFQSTNSAYNLRSSQIYYALMNDI